MVAMEDLDLFDKGKSIISIELIIENPLHFSHNETIRFSKYPALKWAFIVILKKDYFYYSNSLF